MISLLDLFIVLSIAGFFFFGLFFGLIHTLGSLIGVFVSIVLTTRFIDPVYSWVGFMFGGSEIGKIIVFVVLFLLISRLIGLLFWVLKTVFGWFKWIPFVGFFDRLLGGVFGFLEGALVVGVVLYYAQQYLPSEALLTAISQSKLAGPLLALAAAFHILFPQIRDAVTASRQWFLTPKA